MEKKPLISIIIPTKDSAHFFEKCVKEIKKQSYKNLEILIVDGGSTDKTLEIAKKYKLKVYQNKKVLAEPGVALGMNEAKGKYCVVLAVDNFFQSKNAIKQMVNVLETDQIFAIFPKHISRSNANIYTKYHNYFSDPFTHFVKWHAANGRSFGKIYKLIKDGKFYKTYDFNSNKQTPVIALAQGIMVNRDIVKLRKNDYDDILPIIKLIKSKKRIAFANEIGLYHDCTRDLNHFFRKQRWAVSNSLNKQKDFGIASRVSTLTFVEKFKGFIFPIYGVSFVLPLLMALYQVYIKKASRNWLYHPFLTFLAAVAFCLELFLYCTKFSKKPISRQ